MVSVIIIDRTYTSVSNGLYAQFKKTLVEWGGYIYEYDDNPIIYEEHDPFVAAIAAANELEVEEAGKCINKGFV